MKERLLGTLLGTQHFIAVPHGIGSPLQNSLPCFARKVGPDRGAREDTQQN